MFTHATPLKKLVPPIENSLTSDIAEMDSFGFHAQS